MTRANNQPVQAQRRLKILLIHPENNATQEVRAELTAAGHLVMEAARVEDAGRILLNRPINLILIEATHSGSWIDIASRLQDRSGRLSARYTPIFILSDRPPAVLPVHVDAVLRPPLDSRDLLATYLTFLSESVNSGPSARNTTRCCDIEAALDRLGGDLDLFRDLVDRFLDDTAGTRARLEAAVDQADADRLHTAAHSLKGLAASVGATAVVAALADLEALGLKQDLVSVNAVMQRFQSEMQCAAEELGPYHRRTPEPSGDAR